ncbi:MAG: thiamine pyrophosphate-dependent enzyme [Candidatus Pacearchaeota archaeon]
MVCTNFAPIGCSLPESIGAKLASPQDVVFSIQGDGGFQMNSIEIMTAVNYNIPVVFIILNNGILGPIFHSQKKRYGKSFFSEFINPIM